MREASGTSLYHSLWDFIVEQDIELAKRWLAERNAIRNLEMIEK